MAVLTLLAIISFEAAEKLHNPNSLDHKSDPTRTSQRTRLSLSQMRCKVFLVSAGILPVVKLSSEVQDKILNGDLRAWYCTPRWLC